MFADDIEKHGGAFQFTYLSHQHHFLIYKDQNGGDVATFVIWFYVYITDVKFTNKSFMRFAEPLASRVNHLVSACRELIPLTDAEMSMGCYIFPPVSCCNLISCCNLRYY